MHSKTRNVIVSLLLVGVSAALLASMGGCRKTGCRTPNTPKDTTYLSDGDTPLKAAQKSLYDNRALMEEDFEAMGFESRAEVSAATLGTPIPVFLVQIDSVKNLAKGAKPDSQFIDIRRWYFPLMVNGQVRSSIVVEQYPYGYVAVSFGDAPLIKGIAEVSNKLLALFPGTPILVQIPAMSLFIVGVGSPGSTLMSNGAVNNSLKLYNVFKDPSLLLPGDSTGDKPASPSYFFSKLSAAADSLVFQVTH